ncbi:Polycomb group protein MEDEA [Abeliophyllum distichum]|uniref:Polycomb group protein MEDEA n=1 Tax=Abeliophyllum distichum TaxID=126358 RepID=A0ABD1TCM9_9LAMI
MYRSKAQELQKRRISLSVGCSSSQPIPQLENPQIGFLPPNENKESVDSSFFPDYLELAAILRGNLKISRESFVSTDRLLSNCQWIASSASTPIQRSVYYFAEALMERIKKETGSSTSGERNR